MNRKPFLSMIALLLLVALAAIAAWGCSSSTQPPVAEQPAPLPTTHTGGMYVEDLVVTDDVAITDDVTIGGDLSVTGAFSGGSSTWDLNGNKFDLDADADTSITADTDDQIDWEIGGADLIAWKDFTATALTNTVEYIMEIADTTGIGQSGTNSQAALNIDLGIGNSTAGTNTIYGILIDAISQDAQNTETAIAIANGWDRGIDLDGNSIYLDNDQDTIIAEASDDLITLTPGAATGSFEVRTGNLQVGDGTPGETHNGEDFYCEGISEFDGSAYFDGAVDMDGVLTLASDIENVIAPSVATLAITYTAGAGGSGTVATIADGEVWIILGAYAHVTTNWDVTAGDDAYCNIGDGNDADGLLDLDDAELQTADTEGTGAAAGWQGFMSADTAGAYRTQGHPFLYAPSGGAETIDWACGATGDDLTAGALTIYIVYIRVY
jgi:hypothetical protein